MLDIVKLSVEAELSTPILLEESVLLFSPASHLLVVPNEATPGGPTKVAIRHQIVLLTPARSQVISNGVVCGHALKPESGSGAVGSSGASCRAVPRMFRGSLRSLVCSLLSCCVVLQLSDQARKQGLQHGSLSMPPLSLKL